MNWKITKQWLKWIHTYDSNNFIFETYNIFKENNTEEEYNWLKDTKENLEIILNDENFIEYISVECYETIVEDIIESFRC